MPAQKEHAAKATTRQVRGLFVRALGVVSLIAITSLWVQIHGLVGARGILPVTGWLERLRELWGSRAPLEALLQAPTLLWLDSSDLTLHALCFAGAVLAILHIAGRASTLSLLTSWVIYLSLVVGGQLFLSFQWDTLLLETLFWSLFLIPPTLLPRSLHRLPGEPRLGIFLMRLLLFKLMFLSGVVKPLSLDATWLDLSALDFHYETQPLPLWTSWHAHHLPSWFQRLSIALTYGIEIVAPFGLFGPRRLRLACASLLVAFQLLIAATGNYGFFNLITLVLCIVALDDRALDRASKPLQRIGLARRGAQESGVLETQRRRYHRGLMTPVLLLLALNLVVTIREIVWTVPSHRLDGTWRKSVALTESLFVRPVQPVLDLIRPYRTLNGYGLFRAMTTARPEISIEWSHDGVSWHEYRWRFKPSEIDRRPRLAAPHMPRLDWQMWFAALSPGRANWLGPLAQRLLEGEPAVLELLRDAPSERPRYVRFVLYDYRFSSVEERRTSGNWWQRQRIRDLSRPISER